MMNKNQIGEWMFSGLIVVLISGVVLVGVAAGFMTIGWWMLIPIILVAWFVVSIHLMGED